MLSIVKRMLDISGKYKGKLITAIVISFFGGIMTLSPVLLVMFTVYKIATDTISQDHILLMSVLVLVSILLRVVFKRAVEGLQVGSGIKFFADERMRMGEHLKRLPMGYFSSDAIGEVTSTLTTDLTFIEQFGVRNMSVIVNAYISLALSTVMIVILDWRLGIVAIITYTLGLIVLRKMSKLAEGLSKKRQNGIAAFVGAVIEYVKGISIIKSFNMKQADKINTAFENVRNDAIEFETRFTKVYTLFHNFFSVGIAAIVLVVSSLGIGGSLQYSYVLILIIFAFQIFSGFMAISSTASLTRIMETGLNRYDKIMNVVPLDDEGRNVKLNNFDIELKDVSFAYDKQDVLSDINIKIPENSMTALVGKSGCGKTTITNLIARFWDIEKGEVLVGGTNVKEMTCDSLLKNISMVFQNVYLFNDTLLNNIKFAKPDATMDEVVEACKKARCYDFIMELENGFDTVVVESGSSLSG